jgi:hypothetical protein
LGPVAFGSCLCLVKLASHTKRAINFIKSITIDTLANKKTLLDLAVTEDAAF